MKRSQQVILGIAALIVLVMALFPPYHNKSRSLGYHFLTGPRFGSVDVYRWLIQYVAVATVAGVAYWIATTATPKPRTPTGTPDKTLMLCIVAGVLLIVAVVLIYSYV
jgi:hypothetical protein